jgi:hypothetical protein
MYRRSSRAERGGGAAGPDLADLPAELMQTLPDLEHAVDTATPAPATPHATLDVGAPAPLPRPREIGGRDGPEPTRFGDWEKAGRCIDF